MTPFGSWGLLMAFLALLCCPGCGEEASEVAMWTEQLVTTFSKHLLDEKPQWKLYEINVSQDTTVLCYFTCSGRQEIKRFNISVFYPPKQVLLKLQPTFVTIGRWFTIECRVPSVAPLEALTVTLLRGSEILYSEALRGTTLSPQEAIVIHNATAHREDGHHDFSCQAEMDLQSRGGSLIHRVSEPQALEVYEPVQDNQMVIIITVVSVLLFLFVTSVLLCFVFSQQWYQRRTGTYGVQAAWRRLRWPHRV
uniref:Intercellular adhesion molecule 2 n=1 Tax=Catagonus wagneri TaxID=51154 RepID=A0A8C3YR54_9CETA